MTRTLQWILTATLAATSSLCWADNQRGFFAGLGATAVNTDNSQSFNGADLWLGEAIAGYKYAPWLGLEARYGAGLGADTVYLESDESVEADMDIDQYQAVYYRPEAVNRTGRFYALLGYAELEYQLEGKALKTDGFSWGLGIGFILSPRWNLNIEYKNIADVDTQQFTTVNASIDYRF